MLIKISLFIALSVAAIVSQIAINQKFQSEIDRSRIEILKDQIDDTQNQLAIALSKPTYDEGVRDGVENRSNQMYMKGYHMATGHMEGILDPPNEVTSNE